MVRMLIFLLFGARSLYAVDPQTLVALPSGELVIVDASQSIVKVSGTARSALVSSFGIFDVTELAAARLGTQDALFVTLRLRQRSDVAFTRLSRRSATGQELGSWTLPLPGGVLAGIAIDPRRQIVYCSDSRQGAIYKLDLNARQPSFVTMVRIREAGTLGTMAFDAKRGRLLIADAKKGMIFGVTLANSKVEVVLAEGTVREPLGLALDPATDRLYIADATKGRVWVGSLAGPRFTPKTFGTSRFREPVGVAWSKDTLWIADRGTKKLSQFNADGTVLKQIDL